MPRPRTALLVTVLAAGTLTAGTVTGATPPVRADAAGTARPAIEATDAVTAAALARSGGTPVEILSERTETGRVFANPSGTRTLEEYVWPQRTRRDGEWVPIDTRLARAADGSVAPGATVTGLRLSGGGRGPLVSAATGGTELALTWPGALPEPLLDGATATYPEVLPGVDLRVRVDALGFAQLLVVKNAAAAANPALRRIRFGVTTRGLTLRPTPDGGSIAVDSSGATMLVSSAPAMWESPGPGGESGQERGAGPAAVAPRRADMRLQLAAGELAVVPDPAMLADPSMRYPLYIDPSYSATRSLWTMVNADAPGTSYWTDDFYREDVRVGSVYGTGQGPWRTFFHFNIAQLARATISRSWFAITMTHSGACAATTVSLWHTSTLNSASAVTWNNSGGFWLGGAALDTLSGKANKSACGQPAMLMEFGLANGSVRNIVQAAANGPQEAVGFGLRIPSANEGSGDYWKRFDQASARLITEYNTAPHAPTAVSTVPPTPCGTAAAPTALGSATPTFSGVGHDPNGDNVSSSVELLSGETVLSTTTTGTVGSDAAVSWPTIPPGVLPTDSPGTVFSYRSRTKDASLFGPYSTRCYFTVDTTRPAPPSVTSADFPGPVPVKSVGEAGRVTFSRAAADADVAGFRYGFSQNATTMWVAADAAGTATVPVTLWPNPGETGDVSRVLFVRAVDRAGNASPLGAGLELTARAGTVTAAAVRADTNGDRRADVTVLVDQGFDRTTLWSLLASPTGFHAGYIGWDTETAGGMPADRVRGASGDFNGDGRTDMALFREDPDQMIRLFLLTSDGSRFVAASAPAWTGGGLRLSHLKVVAGDFDGDGDDDIALLQGLAGNQARLLVQTNTAGQFGAPVQVWASGTEAIALGQANLVAGDFDGDGDDDIADVYEAAGGTGKLFVHAVNQGLSTVPALRWDGGAAGTVAGRTRFVAGNTNGTGPDEILAVYDDGAAARIATLANSGGTWSSRVTHTSGAGSFGA
jgi:hypothetical protein